MIDRSQVPHLMRLLDDASESVREHAFSQILRLGEDPEAVVAPHLEALTPRQRAAFRELLTQHRSEATRREAWLSWLDLAPVCPQLEEAFRLLAQFQYGWQPPVQLTDLLDDLADGFLASGRPRDAIGLARYLFVSQKFRGDTENFYDPLNSNLIHVIEQRKGLPISLCALFMLVGSRVGIEVHGCNVPRHFLTRAEVNGEDLLFDCFNGGRVLTREERSELRDALSPNLVHLLVESPSAGEIVLRVLNNLIAAYEQADEPAQALLMRDLMRDLHMRMNL